MHPSKYHRRGVSTNMALVSSGNIEQPAGLPIHNRRISLPPIKALQTTALPTPSHMEVPSGFHWNTSSAPAGTPTGTMPPPPPAMQTPDHAPMAAMLPAVHSPSVELHRLRLPSLVNDPFCPAPGSAINSNNSSSSSNGSSNGGSGHPNLNFAERYTSPTAIYGGGHGMAPSTAPSTPSASEPMAVINGSTVVSGMMHSPSMTAHTASMRQQYGHASPEEELPPTSVLPINSERRYTASPTRQDVALRGSMPAHPPLPARPNPLHRAASYGQRPLVAPPMFSEDSSGRNAAEVLVSIGHTRGHSDLALSMHNGSSAGVPCMAGTPHAISPVHSESTVPMTPPEAERHWSSIISGARSLADFAAHRGDRISALYYRSWDMPEVHSEDVDALNDMLQRASAITRSLSLLKTDIARRVETRQQQIMQMQHQLQQEHQQRQHQQQSSNYHASYAPSNISPSYTTTAAPPSHRPGMSLQRTSTHPAMSMPTTASGIPMMSGSPVGSNGSGSGCGLSLMSGDISRVRKRAKRPAPPPPGRCRACNAAETPEWRRGPDGARTLCNACGLHYAKMSKKRAASGVVQNSNLAAIAERTKSVAPLDETALLRQTPRALRYASRRIDDPTSHPSP